MAEELSDEELQTLLTAAGNKGQLAGDTPLANTPLAYDFKRPQRVNKDQLRIIETIHEHFARLSSATLSAAMRMVADVDLAFVDQVPYNEFILSLSSSSSAYGFLMDPPGARAILSFSPELLMALVDRSFGGQGLSYNAEPRPLTQIETNIVNKLVSNIFADLESTWALTTPVHISDVTIETNPEFIQIANSSDPVVLLAFEVHSTKMQELVHLCYPLSALELLLPKLSPNFTQPNKPSSTDNNQLPIRSLDNVKVPVKVQVADGSLPLQELAELRIGEVIKLDTNKDDHAIVFLGNKPKFLGRHGLDGKRRSVLIQRAINQEEEELYQ